MKWHIMSLESLNRRYEGTGIAFRTDHDSYTAPFTHEAWEVIEDKYGVNEKFKEKLLNRSRRLF